MIQKLFIFWASWNVWRELVRQILELDYNSFNSTIIVWVSNKDSYIFNENWIDLEILKQISSSDSSAIAFEKHAN